MSWHMTQKQLVPICSRFTNYYTTSRFISPWFFSLSIKLTISCLQRADTLLAKRVQTGQQFWSPILHVLLAQAAFWQQRTEVFRSDSDAVTANGRCRLGHTRCSFRFHFSYLSQNLLAENCANYRIQILKCNTHTSTTTIVIFAFASASLVLKFLKRLFVGHFGPTHFRPRSCRRVV